MGRYSERQTIINYRAKPIDTSSASIWLLQMQGSLTSGGFTLEDIDLGNEFVFTLPSADTGLRGGCS